MVLPLAFGVLLMVAVLLSERANCTALSTSVLLLAGGFLLGQGGLGWIDIERGGTLVEHSTELALFVILFVEGSRLPVHEVTRAWHLPGRALLLAMPLTFAAIAIAGHAILDMGWVEAMLVAAILSPTDPVVVAAVLENEHVPERIRRLLSVESGLNDGLALPAVMVLIEFASHESAHPLLVIGQAALGAALGAVVAAAFAFLERRTPLTTTGVYDSLAGVALAIVLFGLAKAVHGNEFLAAFVGGITFATLHPRLASDWHGIGDSLAELLKLATLMGFGAMLSLDYLAGAGWAGLAFAVVALLAARPLAFILAFFRGGLSTKEWIAAAWFGPKGFASLLYAFLMVHADIEGAGKLFQVIALVIVLSVLSHSSTDVFAARVFRREERGPAPPSRERYA